MLIQNTSSIAPQSVRLSGDGGFANVATANQSTTSKAASISEQTQPGASPLTPKQLRSTVDSVNKSLQQSNRMLEFSIDEETSRTIVKLMDSETGEVVRQIPSEEMLAISRSIDQFQQGMLLNQKA